MVGLNFDQYFLVDLGRIQFTSDPIGNRLVHSPLLRDRDTIGFFISDQARKTFLARKWVHCTGHRIACTLSKEMYRAMKRFSLLRGRTTNVLHRSCGYSRRTL
jgi:hypothetical protein